MTYCATWFIAAVMLTVVACGTPAADEKSKSTPVTYRPDSSQLTQEIRQHFDSVIWQKIVFAELGVSVLIPANWGQCPRNESVLMCALDSLSDAHFKSNITVSVYSNVNLVDFEKKMAEERQNALKWTLVEDGDNPYFWAKNSYASYTTTHVQNGRKDELGFWCYAFVHQNRVIEITLVGLLSDVDHLDYLFKFLTARIERT